jgi:hypothetical protein
MSGQPWTDAARMAVSVMTALFDETDGGTYDNAFAQEVIASYLEESDGAALGALITGFMNMSVLLVGQTAIGRLSENEKETIHEDPAKHLENMRGVLRNISTVLNQMDAEAEKRDK